jgi:DNA-binding beta-propeller fold protein YncE
VENHKDCKEVAILENIIKNVKTSSVFNEIERLIDELFETIGKIRQNRETNISDVKEQKILVESEIRELRRKIDKHFDKLQESLIMELTEKEKVITEQTLELLVTLAEKQKEITEHQTNIVNIKKYASELQTFIAVKQIEKDVETQDTCIQSIVNSNGINQSKLSYKMDTSINTIITSIQKFGEVVVESKPCELTFVRGKDKQAQIMVADLSPHMPVENIQLKLKQVIYYKGKGIGGCSFLPDGRMVMSCFHTNTLRFINKEGEEYFQIGVNTTRACMFDTVYIKYNKSVAVSSGHGRNKCITIIDIESKKVMTTIPMYVGVYRMAVRGRTIYYCSSSNGLEMLNLSDQSVSDIIISDKLRAFCVATSGDKLYYINRYNDTVKCCNLHGTTEWEFTDKCVITMPEGITVDNEGNVYVVVSYYSNVVVISPDGKRHRQLLSSEDGMIYPRVIEYDKCTNRLLVVNASKSAYLFDVTRGE